jgi:hypothetical protein
MSQPTPFESGYRDNWKLPLELGFRKASQVFIVRFILVLLVFVLYLPLVFLVSTIELTFFTSIGLLSLTGVWILVFARYILPVTIRLSVRNPRQGYGGEPPFTGTGPGVVVTQTWVQETISYARSSASREKTAAGQ